MLLAPHMRGHAFVVQKQDAILCRVSCRPEKRRSQIALTVPNLRHLPMALPEYLPR